MADIEWDESALNRLLFDPSGPVGVYLTGICVDVESAAKRLCPVDTGRLRSSITHRVERQAGGLVGTVGTNVSYAYVVEVGHHTRPRRVVAQSANAARRALARGSAGPKTVAGRHYLSGGLAEVMGRLR